MLQISMLATGFIPVIPCSPVPIVKGVCDNMCVNMSVNGELKTVMKLYWAKHHVI